MNIAKLKIADLKRELKERGLPTSGNKSELAARLRDALGAEGGDAGGPGGGQAHEEDLEAKESELLGEEEEDEEDTASPEDLDTKLLETSTATAPATPAAKPKKITINREAAESAQQAAEIAIAEAAKAAPPPPAAPAPATVPVTAPDAGDTPPASKRIKLTGLTEAERLAKRAEKLGGVTASDKLSNLKILTPEERKAARLAKFSSGTDDDAGIKVLTPEERKAARLAKFGAATGDEAGIKVLTPEERKAARLAKFGSGDGSAQKNGTEDLDKLKKRADRFGEAVSPQVKTLEESERMQKRKARFGIVTPEDAKARRAARFSSGLPIDPATEDKKKLRAARFGLA